MALIGLSCACKHKETEDVGGWFDSGLMVSTIMMHDLRYVLEGFLLQFMIRSDS